MRSGGILMPISALPGSQGIGTMGREARAFVDFLQAAGQRYWQILPVCPTSYGDSPYQTFCSFAGNPYFIDLDLLAREGYLAPEDYEGIDWGDGDGRIDYGTLYAKRYPVLRKAFAGFMQAPPPDFLEFCRREADWLEDYALFMALKDAHGGAAWQEWEEPLRRREEKTLEAVRAKSREDMDFWRCVQYLFFRQWKALKAYANERGIRVIGDLPIYVSGDSVDVWANPRQFQLGEDLKPVEVAGCPPDAFTEDGQLWGNPLFDWAYMEKEGYRWWLRRIASQCEVYDVVRIDHFRGFESYYAIPYGAETAKIGRWRPGPGIAFFRAVEEALGKREIIVEDLGFITDEVREMVRQSGFPNMKVTEFGFDADGESDHTPHNFLTHSVAYTGTHDNSPVLGWAKGAPRDAAYAAEYLHITPEEGLNWGMMRGIWSSVSELAVVQMQDVLGLGDEARINVPSTVGENWRWRMAPGVLTEELALRLRHQMELYRRI